MMCSILSVITSYRIMSYTVRSLRNSNQAVKPLIGISSNTRGIRSKIRRNSFVSKIESLFMINNIDNDQRDPVDNMKLKILKYPNPKLRNENEVVKEFDNNLMKIASSMLSIMYTSDGVGLAAPQVGINKRLMVFNELGNTASRVPVILTYLKVEIYRR